MAGKRRSANNKSLKPISSRARNRRLAQQNRKSQSLSFEALEDRRLLATVTVGNSLDLVDGDTSSIASLISSPGADGISLREAITASNNTFGADTITFDTLVFTGGIDSLIRLTGGELEITDSLTIDASAAIDVTITGDTDGDDITDASFITDVAASFGGTAGAADDLLDDNSRVLNFSSDTGNLTLAGLTITGGRTTEDNQLIFSEGVETTHSGGGIRFASDSQLTLISSTVSGNSTAGELASGGGILAGTMSTFALIDSTVSGNSTSGVFGSGGGIAGGSATLINSTVSGNSTFGLGAYGGGISTSNSPLTLADSTVSGNSTAGYTARGGGIFTYNGPLTLADSTVSGNSTAGYAASGGGIYTSNSPLTLTGSTVSENFTTGFSAEGGGISVREGSVTLIGSEVNGNSTSEAFSSGGGIYTLGGSLTLTNSTVSQNSTSGYDASGGGIAFAVSNDAVGRGLAGEFILPTPTPTPTLTLTNSTVSGNSTTGESASGGGIHSLSSATTTLTGSSVSGNSTAGPDANGGGISSFLVALTNSDVSGNSTTGDRSGGGGISAGIVGLTNSTVSENSTAGEFADGGGINAQSVGLTDSTVSRNSTAGDDARGGGIYGTSITVVKSTVSGNSTSGVGAGGGGIYGEGGSYVEGFSGDGGGTYTGSITLENSTVSGNSTAGVGADGGGIYSSSQLTLSNSTVSGNASAGEGGGVYAYFYSPLITIENSILAGNLQNKTVDTIGTPNDFVLIDVPGAEFNLSPTINHSLIGVADNITQTIDGNVAKQFGTAASPIDPLLGPLAFNGGPTQTHALLPGSPAIDAGSNDLAVDQNGDPLLNDQRGTGFDRIVSGTVDVGAFEFGSGVAASAPVVSSVVRDEGGVLARPDLISTFAIAFDQDVTVAQGDLVIRNDTLGGTAVDTSSLNFTYDATTLTATWNFADLILDPAFYSFELSENIVSAAGNIGLDGNLDGNPGGAFVGSVYVAIPGDANLDGQVDVLSDAFALVGNLGLSGGATWAQGDFDGDGNVTVLGDAFILIGNLGQSVALLPTQSVPTPQTFTVTSNMDGPVTAAGDLPGSLRQAIFDANANLGADTIEFDSSVFTGGNGSLIRLAAGELEITDSLTIDGSTGTDVTITGDANGDDITLAGGITDLDASGADLLDDNSRVLNFSSTTGDLTLESLAITGGRTTGNTGGFIDTPFEVGGGGIRSVSSGSLTLTNSTVSGNSTTGAFSSGGGISADYGGVVTLSNSAITGNRSVLFGGGIAGGFNTTLTLIDSTVSGNLASPGGGAIHSDYGVVALTNTTVNGNNTSGVVLQGLPILPIESLPRASLTLANSTISGNSNGSGVGVYGIFAVPLELTITSSTITGNTSGGVHAGFYNAADGVKIDNSIIAGNTVIGGMPRDLTLAVGDYGNSNTFNHNLIGVADGVTITGVGNLTGTAANPLDPQLGPLADNGGPTLTHALLPGSPAIDAGDNSLAVDADGNPLLTDQRGAAVDRIFGGTVDIGAFEFGSGVVASAPVVSSVVRDEGGVLARPDLISTFSVSFNLDVNLSPDDLVIRNDTLGGSVVDSSGLLFDYDATTFTVTADFSNLTLDPGFYTFELSDNIVSVSSNVSLDGDGDGNPGGAFIDSVYVALPGDANLDGQVDVLSDAFALIGNLGLSGGASWAQGDFNDDGDVDVLGDAFILIGQLGQSVIPPATSQLATTLFAVQSFEAAVPTQQVVLIAEPETSSLIEGDDEDQNRRLPTSSAPVSLAGSLTLDAAFEDLDLFEDGLFI